MGNKCEGCKWFGSGSGIAPCLDCERRRPPQDHFEPAEPVVLSALGMYQRKLGSKTWGQQGVLEYGEAMHQNGRLERDLELRGLVESLKKMFVNHRGGSKTHKISISIAGDEVENVVSELENIKPLNKD